MCYNKKTPVLMKEEMIITKETLDLIIKQRENRKFSIKVDLGKREVSVKVEDDYALLDNSYKLSLSLKLKGKFCYLLKRNNGFSPLAFYDGNTKHFYKLMPTQDWPTVTIGSVPMHRIRRLSPREDSYRKIEFLKPYGVVLDTCMGLGYTAILAAQRSRKVYTFEVDKNIYLLAKMNPWSEDLFQKKNIVIKQEDITEAIDDFCSAYFDCIIHDPPTFKLAPLLYSVTFYRRLFKHLKGGGKLFHYTPLYRIKQAKNFPLAIKSKLKDAGFKIIAVDIEKGGILCKK